MRICIDGPDRVGKETQSKILADRLGVPVLSYPNYESDAGKRIERMLKGTELFNPLKMQHIQAEDKMGDLERVRTLERNFGYVVIDRYTPSAYVYGLHDRVSLEYLIHLNIGLPESDITIILSGEPHVLEGDHYEVSGKQKDIRRIYELLAKAFRWYVVNANQSIEKVSNDIWKIVKMEIKAAELVEDKVSDDTIQEELQEKADPNTEY